MSFPKKASSIRALLPKTPVSGVQLPPARGRAVRRTSGEMNKTEALYASHLDKLQAAGDIAAWWFEVVTFRIAPDCRYTPDFLVMMPDGIIEVHEVKGFWEDDALVKIKVAAQMFPFRFVAIHSVAKKDGGGWKVREF